MEPIVFKSQQLPPRRVHDRSNRFFKRKRRLVRVGANKTSKLKLIPKYESEDECLGDSEKSDDSEFEEEKNNNKRLPSPEPPILRKQCSLTRQSLAEDQLENNRKGQLVCLTCLKEFSNIQNLRRHLRLHLHRDSNVAEIDSDGQKINDMEKKFQCDFCPEKFDNKSAFQVHEKTHGSQELICFVCEKKYQDRYSLRYHLRTHGIGQQIRCELCGKNFTKKSRLKSHIETFHENVRKFQCPNCDKAFKAKVHLDHHMLQHSGEKPFKCNECGDSFRHKLSLISHQRIHSDSRPYVCDTCGRTFRDSSTLKAHNRVHSGDKPYKCNLCDKSFTQRAGLNYHKNVHLGTKPHKCNQCEYSTAKKASLLNHMKTIHKPGVHISVDTAVTTRRSSDADQVTPVLSGPAPLPSPPSQQGDAMFSGHHNSAAQHKYEEPLSHSLPSFNILKSYDSSSLQGAIVGDHSRPEPEISSYESHSDPSLSPPLTPPISEFQEHQQTLHSYTSHQSFAPLNYSTYSHRDTDCHHTNRFSNCCGGQCYKRDMCNSFRTTFSDRVKNNSGSHHSFYTNRDLTVNYLENY